MAEDRFYDLIIIGAGMESIFDWTDRMLTEILGPNGLIMGKTYLEVNPAADVLLLDESSTVGGTWAKDRLYAGLKTNNLEGGYEFADFPMQGQARYGLKHDEHIPGKVMNQYMQDFADHFGLTQRTRFNCKAHTVERLGDGTWLVKADERGTERQLHTRRLVVSTGLTNRPFVPYFQGQEKFDCPISHVKDPRVYSDLLSSVKSVTLLNVTKSAYDVAYACATKGIQVHWVVRKSGHGPNFMTPARVTPLLKRIEDIGCVRAISWFSPCLWTGADGFPYYRCLLHGTRLGRKLISGLWSIINQDVITRARYDEHPETAKLKPRGETIWYACTLGIFNYDDDFMSYVRNGSIKIYDDDIDHLSPHAVHLSSGTTLQSDALICSTGWDHRSSLVFHPPSLPAELGLPTNSSESPITPSLIERTNAVILQSLPWLAQNRPTINPNYQPLATVAPRTDDQPIPDTRTHPYRLYRFLVPPTHATSRDPTIAFLGFIWAIPTALVAQTSALWLTAYFAGRLPQQQHQQPPLQSSPSSSSSSEKSRQDKILWETARDTQFALLRYPGGFGARFPDLAFDALPYVDMLVGDLGLEVHRKRGGWWWGRWWREAWEHYSIRDYRGVVGEWMAKEGMQNGKGVANGRVKGD